MLEALAGAVLNAVEEVAVPAIGRLAEVDDSSSASFTR